MILSVGLAAGDRSRPRAFTLAEVILSVALIGVAMLALVGVFVASMPLLAQNREVGTASSLVRGLHEQIRAGGAIPKSTQVFRGSTPDPALNGFPPAPYPAITVAGVAYTFKVSTSLVPSHVDLVTVEIEATWGQGHSLTQQCQYYVP